MRQPITYFDSLPTTLKTIKPTDGRAGAGAEVKNAAGSNTTAGAVAVKITNNANILQIGISEKLGLFLQSLAMLFSAFIVAFIFQWELTLVTLTILPAMSIIYGIIIPIEIRREGQILSLLNQAAGLAEEAFSSIRTVVSFNAEDRLAARYNEHLSKAHLISVRKAPMVGLIFATGLAFLCFGYSLCFWYGIRMVTQGKLGSAIEGVGTVVTVFFSVLMAVMSFAGIAPNVSAITKAAGVAQEIWTLVDLPVEDDGHGQTPDSSKTTTSTKVTDATDNKYSTTSDVEEMTKDAVGQIEFRHVTFAYPSRPTIPVLQDISCVFEAKKKTALVGSSGSGKSTIVSLLERWYDPQADGVGDILLDGRSFVSKNGEGGVGRRWLRSQIGLVSQEPFLFNETIYRNVVFGMYGSEWESKSEEEKRQRVIQLCTDANAHGFIQSLPDGYDTRVGPQGIQLSGGKIDVLKSRSGTG